MFLFSLSPNWEKALSGRPKSVSVRVTEVTPENQARVEYLQEETTFDTEGRTVERRIYRSDGSLSSLQEHRYTAAGLLTEIKTRDSDRTLTQRLQILRSGEGLLEGTLLFGADGKEREQTTITLNEEGLVSKSSTKILPQGTSGQQMNIGYDSENRPSSAVVIFPNEPRLNVRFEMSYAADGNVITNISTPDREVVAHTWSGADSLEARTIAFGADSPNPRSTIERIEMRDEIGNWTTKSIVVGGPQDETVALQRIYMRSITYY